MRSCSRCTTPQTSHQVLLKSTSERFAFIDACRAEYSVTRLCRQYGVTRSGCDAWRTRPASAHAEQDRRLSMVIQRIFAAPQGRYGSPRVHRVLVRHSDRGSEYMAAPFRDCVAVA